MKKITLALTITALVAGCATTVQPQQAVNMLDTGTARYETAECRSARQVAMGYDDNVGGRIGVGLGLGLLLGPFGLPFAVMADSAQAEKRNAVLAELHRHCGGQIHVAGSAGTPAGVVVVDGSERTECVPAGTRAGEIVKLRFGGEVLIKTISASNTQCGGLHSPPQQATVVNFKRGTPPPATSTAVQEAALARQVADKPAADSPAASRLRDLAAMLRDGLITQQEHDRKREEILRTL